MVKKVFSAEKMRESIKGKNMPQFMLDIMLKDAPWVRMAEKRGDFELDELGIKYHDDWMVEREIGMISIEAFEADMEENDVPDEVRALGMIMQIFKGSTYDEIMAKMGSVKLSLKWFEQTPVGAAKKSENIGIIVNGKLKT